MSGWPETLGRLLAFVAPKFYRPRTIVNAPGGMSEAEDGLRDFLQHAESDATTMRFGLAFLLHIPVHEIRAAARGRILDRFRPAAVRTQRFRRDIIEVVTFLQVTQKLLEMTLNYADTRELEGSAMRQVALAAKDANQGFKDALASINVGMTRPQLIRSAAIVADSIGAFGPRVSVLMARRVLPALALRRSSATRVLDTWAAILPNRIVREDLADYSEAINRRVGAGQKWLVWLNVLAAIFWTGVNAIGYLRKKLRKRGGA